MGCCTGKNTIPGNTKSHSESGWNAYTGYNSTGYNPPSYRTSGYIPSRYRSTGYSSPSYGSSSHGSSSYSSPSYGTQAYLAPEYRPSSYSSPAYRVSGYKPSSYKSTGASSQHWLTKKYTGYVALLNNLTTRITVEHVVEGSENHRFVSVYNYLIANNQLKPLVGYEIEYISKALTDIVLKDPEPMKLFPTGHYLALICVAIAVIVKEGWGTYYKSNVQEIIDKHSVELNREASRKGGFSSSDEIKNRNDLNQLIKDQFAKF